MKFTRRPYHNLVESNATDNITHPPHHQAHLRSPTQNPALKTKPKLLPKDIIDPIEKEAQAIWHITELLSKLESPDNDSITLTTATIQHITQQISTHLSNIMEHVDSLG